MGDADQFAFVKIQGAKQLVTVPISSGKPEVAETIQEKWQGIVDLVAGILKVPTGLITHLTTTELEIFVASRTEGNPYKRNDKDKLGIGMFCESVAGKQNRLLVANTEDSDYWKNNPHAAFGMKAYLGLPIRWEDGELFGTFCMLDDKANAFSPDFIGLMERFKDIIETDLRYLLLYSELEKRLSASEMQLREIHHRLKNQFNILTSYISLQSQFGGTVGLQDTLKDIQHRIMALSIIHDELYHSERITLPPLDVYLPRLCRYILDDFAKSDVDIQYAIAALELPMNAEISIALMVSELLTNSLKHAFTAWQEKQVRISVERIDQKHITLVYRDSGKGLPASFDPAASASLGMTLLRALTGQLGGTMRAATDGGAVFTFILEL